MKNNYGNTIPISGSKIAKFSEKADIEIFFDITGNRYPNGSGTSDPHHALSYRQDM